MFEFAKMIHEALGVESTWVVVVVTALIFAAVGGGAGLLVDSAYKHSSEYKAEHAPKPDDAITASVARIRGLIAEGDRIVQTCQSVPNPYQTPASSRADLANVIVEFRNRVETVLSMDSDPRPQKMWRAAVLHAVPQNPMPIAIYCTELNLKMDTLNRILKRKTTTRQQLRGQLERFIREGASLQAACSKSESDAAKTIDNQLSWISKVTEWLGDNFDETYQDQFNSVAPATQEQFHDYSSSVKGWCERTQPRIDVLDSIYRELSS